MLFYKRLTKQIQIPGNLETDIPIAPPQDGVVPPDCQPHPSPSASTPSSTWSLLGSQITTTSTAARSADGARNVVHQCGEGAARERMRITKGRAIRRPITTYESMVRRSKESLKSKGKIKALLRYVVPLRSSSVQGKYREVDS
ncbi:uncharacterized protein LOC111298697 [Durio zibethinus]|uniref:Uncharacterized protein LOC111298697 n=1 Tax=Durio zibethinus TaxID=66656 RepID=A0A6P5Z9E3_DURZI|nr:uncharacterized protein LOC111298697 [Durio zibethinus]